MGKKKLEFHYGSMLSGKTLSLLSVAHNYTRIGQTAKIFTTALDNRFGNGIVASRTGLSAPATLFTKETHFSKEMIGDGVAVVLIDEAQFLERFQVLELAKIAALDGIPVLAWGLRTDYRGEPFPGSAALLTLADRIEELRSVCQCGKRANFQIRIDAEGNRVREGEQVLIGDANYRQTCSACFYSESEVA